MGNGGGAHAGFIGEYTPGYAGAKGKQHGSNRSCGDGPGVKSTPKNSLQCLRQGICAQNKSCDTQKHIASCGKGHQKLCDAADTASAAKEHKSDENRQSKTDHQLARRGKAAAERGRRLPDGSDDRIDLGGIADAKGGDHTEKAIDSGKKGPLFAHPMPDDVHGATDEFTGWVFLPEMHRKGDLREFDHHAKKARDPHPENSTGASQGDRSGHAG